jgi:outer membrane biosynthesis protein TonB
MANQRKDQKVSKVGMVVSITLHTGVIAVLLVLAAREGMFGKHIKTIAVTRVPDAPPSETPNERPKAEPLDKPPEPKHANQPPKVEPPTLAKATIPVQPVRSGAMLPPAVVPSVAVPPAAIPDLLFDGGKAVQSSSDPKALYQNFVEYTLRSNWKRPDNLVDLDFVAEIEVGINRTGQITSRAWVKGSGNPTWDNSVRQALARTKTLERTPPNGFPDKVLVRFDVLKEADALQP